MRKKMAKKFKICIWAALMLMLFASRAFALEIEVNLSFGSYAKADDYLKQLYGKNNTISGFGTSLYLTKHIGLFFDTDFMSAGGVSTYDEKTLAYKENHISVGLQYLFTLYSFTPARKLKLYFKGGGLFLHYSETFEEKISETIPGICFGAGVIFCVKHIGLGLEAVKNYAYEEIEILGLDMVEKINFSGFRFSLKGVYTF